MPSPTAKPPPEASTRDILRGLAKAFLIGLAFSALVTISLLSAKGLLGEAVKDLSRVRQAPPAIDPEELAAARRRLGAFGLLSMNTFALGFTLSGSILVIHALQRTQANRKKNV